MSHALTTALFAPASIPYHLLSTASLVLLVAISDTSAFLRIAGWIPTFQLIGLVVLRYVLERAVKTRRGSWLGRLGVRELRDSIGGDAVGEMTEGSEGENGQGAWKRAGLGGLVTALELWAVVKSVQALGAGASLAMLSLVSPLLLVPFPPSLTVFKTSTSPILPILFFASSFSLLLSSTPDTAGIAHTGRLGGIVVTGLVVAIRVGGWRKFGLSWTVGEVRGGKKGGLIAILVSVLLNALSSQVGVHALHPRTFRPFHICIPLLVVFAVLFGISSSIALPEPLSTLSSSSRQGSRSASRAVSRAGSPPPSSTPTGNNRTSTSSTSPFAYAIPQFSSTEEFNNGAYHARTLFQALQVPLHTALVFAVYAVWTWSWECTALKYAVVFGCAGVAAWWLSTGGGGSGGPGAESRGRTGLRGGGDEDLEVEKGMKTTDSHLEVTPAAEDESTTASARAGLLGGGSPQQDSGLSPVLRVVLLVISLLPLLFWSAREVAGSEGMVGFVTRFAEEENVVRGVGWQSDVDFEIAVAYYDESVDIMKSTIASVKDTIPASASTKVTIYAKGPGSDTKPGLWKLRDETNADEVVGLKNVGREGETYLQHIVRHHSSTLAPLATHTYFMQPHLAWHWVANPRLRTVHAKTGFMSFGPYLNASCTSDGNEKDSHGQSHARIGQVYSSFRGELCPPNFLITWAGQFVVSRTRIENNPKATYQNLLDFFDVGKNSGEDKDWIWKEGWWNNEPSNPTLGHALERSWPIIFDCGDPSPAFNCKEGDSGSACECRDP